MNKKAQSGGKIFFVFILMLLMVAILFFIFGDKYEATASIHDKVFGEKGKEIRKTVDNFNEQHNTQFVEPPKENDWCKIQDIAPSTDFESYSKDAIIGWDNLEQCCVREVSGYNCALHEDNSYVRYCYTSNIGGRIVWTSINGYYINASDYKIFIADLDKGFIENKPCDITKYPVDLRNYKNV